MPLTVPCPKCATKLLAPNSAVGRQLRCPKCGSLATVPDLIPAEEVEVVDVVEAKVVPPPPKPKPVVAEEAEETEEEERPRRRRRDDDEDEEDERPRKKKRPRFGDDDDYDPSHTRRRPRRKSGGNGVLIAGLIVGGLLLLAGVGFAVYFFAGGKGSPFVKKSPVPAGWEQHNYPNDGLKLYLPKAPNYTSGPADLRLGRGMRGGGRFGMGGFELADDLPEADRIAQISVGDWKDSVQIELWVIRFRERVPSSIRDEIRRRPTNTKIGDVELRSIKWLGHDAAEIAHTNGVMRAVYTERHFVMAMISGRDGKRATAEEEAGFFDNIEVTN